MPGEKAGKESRNPAGWELPRDKIKVAHARTVARIEDRLAQTGGCQLWLHRVYLGTRKRS